MKNPYEILGVSMYATREQINAAYQQLSRQYAESGNMRKQQELDEAYDRIMLEGDYSFQNVYYGADFSDIRHRIDSGRLEDAQILLDGVPESQRNGEWNYLKGTICQKKGWLEEAEKYFRRATELDSSNETYKSAYDNINSYSNGGYKTKGKNSDSDCSCCNICSGLLCADCCCECMGGDIIPCC
ncbi:MAG: J domain-containing protein [Clostridia bacterium]|nr:J domain-containing protein [Clostridia bacterium]